MGDYNDDGKLCRDFMRNVCHRGNHCKFIHPTNIAIRTEPIFCHDYQQNKCRRSTCKFIHCTKQEEDMYKQTGDLPSTVDTSNYTMDTPKNKKYNSSKSYNNNNGNSNNNYGFGSSSSNNNKGNRLKPLKPPPLPPPFFTNSGSSRYSSRSNSGEENENHNGMNGMNGNGNGPLYTRRRQHSDQNNYYNNDGPTEPKRRFNNNYNGNGNGNGNGSDHYSSDYDQDNNFGNSNGFGGSYLQQQIPPPPPPPQHHNNGHSDPSMKALEEENFMLKRRIEELKTANEFLLNQNAQLRLNNQLSKEVSKANTASAASIIVSMPQQLTVIPNKFDSLITTNSSQNSLLPLVSTVSLTPVISSISSISQQHPGQCQPQTVSYPIVTTHGHGPVLGPPHTQ